MGNKFKGGTVSIVNVGKKAGTWMGWGKKSNKAT
jgi:hypothetical protein